MSYTMKFIMQQKFSSEIKIKMVADAVLWKAENVQSCKQAIESKLKKGI